MRRPPDWGSPGASGNRARLAGAATIALALALGCRNTDGPPGGTLVRSVVVSVAQSTILVGATTQASAKLIDADGNQLFEPAPFWLSATPAIIRVSERGEITGLQAGTGQVRAQSDGVFGSAPILVRNPVAVAIQLAQSTASVTLPGGAFQAIATVTDELGRPMPNPPITWTSQHPLIATVNVAGLISGVASGNATITATIDGLTATLAVQVRPVTATGAPTIVSVTPSPLRPGGTFTLIGTNFSATAAANHLLVDGVGVNVLNATATQLSISLPATGFACEPSRDALLQVTAGGLIGAFATPLQTGNRRALSAGQSVIVADADEVRCNELVPGHGRWVVSIYNASRASVTPASTGSVQFQIRGLAGADFAGAPALVRERAAPSSVARYTPAPHVALLETNLAAFRDARLRRGSAAIAASPGGGPRSQLTIPNAITSVKVPNLDAADFCVANFAVNARTVFAGPHAVILEDTVGVFNGKATLRGQMDDYFVRLGTEFEAIVWPIISESFGNPLAMDAQLSNIGRVVMVFSPRVNAMRAGAVTGFVANCDFFPVGQRPSSNGGAFFYAAVPTSFAPAYSAPETRDHWLRLLRSTVPHELKHLASFAERLSRNLPVEELSWEEGSARVAEEIFSRSLYGSAPLANTGYAPSVGCDLRYELGVAPCADRPLLMIRHFDALYQYLAAPEIFSPLGRVSASDVTFYAPAWSVLRWAADHFGPSESSFFRDFTASSVAGVPNIEARTGRRWEEALGEWSLAAYLDDVTSFTSANSLLRLPSWNHPEIWRGLCNDLGPCVNASNPIQLYRFSTPFTPRQRSFGNFQFVIGTMIGGGVSYLDLDGPGSAAQTIEIKSATGPGEAPPSVRIAIVRVR